MQKNDFEVLKKSKNNIYIKVNDAYIPVEEVTANELNIRNKLTIFNRGRKMKELTHEEWMKNPTPRIMWVWDDDETCKKKRKVIYISEYAIRYPVIALADNGADTYVYMHCAEIAKTRRMTNKEFSRWLRENPTREYKYHAIDGSNSFIHYSYSYIENCDDDEISGDILIRENDGEWREPLVEDK